MQPTRNVFPNWQEKVVFSPEGPQPQFLYTTDKFRVLVAALEPGQRIPAHPEALAMYHFLQGTGWMSVDQARFPVQEGATVIVENGAQRGIEADTRLIFLAARVT